MVMHTNNFLKTAVLATAAAAQPSFSQPGACTNDPIDIVFYLDTSDTPGAGCVNNSAHAIIALATQTQNFRPDILITVYYDEPTVNTQVAINTIQAFISTGTVSNLTLLNIRTAIVSVTPTPPCIPGDGFGTPAGCANVRADWAYASAEIAWWHPWRCDARRAIVPISAEGPRCGNVCLSSTPSDEDIAAATDASLCLLTNRVSAYPVIVCLPSFAGDCSVPGYCPISSGLALATPTFGTLFSWDCQFEDDLSSFVFDFVIEDQACGYNCDIDFNNDNLYPSDEDLIDFLIVLAGGDCSNFPFCDDIDINNDCLYPSDDDLIAFLARLAGNCGD